MNKFYSIVSYKSLNEIKEALIKNHQFLEDEFMNFTEVELQEEGVLHTHDMNGC